MESNSDAVSAASVPSEAGRACLPAWRCDDGHVSFTPHPDEVLVAVLMTLRPLLLAGALLVEASWDLYGLVDKVRAQAWCRAPPHMQ